MSSKTLAQGVLTQAVAHHQAGRLREAAEGYVTVLRSDPRHPDALHLLGVVALQTGQPEKAETLIRQAIAQDAGVADYWDNLGSALMALGRPKDAVDAHSEAVNLNPESAPNRHNLGNALHAAGMHGTAIVVFVSALVLKPDYAKAWYNIGNTLRAQGRLPDAIQALRRAVQLLPGMVEAHNNLGDALAAAGRLDEALAEHRMVASLRPDDAKAHYNLGAILQQRGAFESAEIAYREALRRQPRHAAALNNLGSVLKRLGRPAQAEQCHRQALEIHPDFVEARYNLGNALQALGRLDEAAACYEQALEQNPNLATASYNLALLALLHGDLGRGWTGYERRFASGEVLPNRRIPLPHWKGEVLRGRRLLIWREQGVGDEILFASCYPDVVAWAGGPVTIECDPRLVTLFQRSFPGATVRAESCTPEGDETIQPPDCDLQAAAGSLPHRLRETLSGFDTPAPWLVPDPARVAHWADRLAALGPGLRVGIGWRSQLMTAERRSAYVALEAFAPLFAVPGLTFVNLQYDDCEAELRAAEERFGVRIHRWSDLDLMNDLEGAAALTANLDLVISPAMSAGELAGALGVPVWRFCGADWTQLGTAVRPWFPSMRLFQPQPGEALEATIPRMARLLRDTAGVALPPAAPSLPPPAPPPPPSPPLPPADPEALLNEAVALHRQGRLDEAEAAYCAMLRAVPDHADALHLLGLLDHQAGRHEHAAVRIGEALRLEPEFPAAWNHLGLVRQAQERLAEAEACFKLALALRPAFPEALTHLGLRHHAPGRLSKAIVWHRRSILLSPENQAAHTNIGHACEMLGRFAEATAHYRRALALRPDSPDAHNNLATLANLEGRTEEVPCHLRRALRIEPGFPLAAWNLGLIELAEGRIAEGWAGYERRFSARQLQRARNIPRPKWRGEALNGRTLLVWSEQGVGDEILFASVFSDLAGLADGPSGGRVIVECDRRLVTLFQRAFPWATVRPETVDAAGRETMLPPDCDLQIAAGSLPALLRDRLDRFPHRPAFLSPEPGRLAHWRERVAALGPGLTVGIAWRSQIVTAQRKSAYTSIADWLPVVDMPGIVPVTLQYGDCRAELASVETNGRRLHRWDDLDLKDDFEGVSALISCLDLVIAPATAVGELAGALGTPTWRLCTPDWTYLGSAVRPWFPTMRPFAPNPGEGMSDVVARVAAALSRLAGSAGPR